MKANFHAEVRKGIGTRPRVIFRYHEGQILAATTHFFPHSYNIQGAEALALR